MHETKAVAQQQAAPQHEASGFLQVRLFGSHYPWGKECHMAKKVLHDAAGVDEKSAKVTIDVIPREYKLAIQRPASAARRIFNQNSVPIIDPAINKPSQDRACTAAGLIRIERACGQNANLYQEWKEAVARLFAEYDQAKSLAESRFAQLGVELKFPTPEGLRKRRDGKTDWFRWTLAEPQAIVMEAGLGGIFKNLPQDMLRQKEAEYTAQMRRKFAASQADGWKRIVKEVGKMAETLNAYQGKGKGHAGKFHGTLISNVENIVDSIPAINIFSDPELEKMGDKLKTLTRWDAEQLRESEAARKVVAEDAQGILDEIRQCGFV